MENICIKYLDIKLKKGDLIGVVGPSGSGKTFLLKKISGRVYNDDILINNRSLKSYDLEYKRKNIVTVFNDNIFNTKEVLTELKYYLNYLEFTKKEIDKRINNFISYFKLEKILNNKLDELSLSDKFFIKILSLLIIKPKLFCIDDLITYLNVKNKKKLFTYIKENNIILVSVTTNMEDINYYNKLLILDNNKKFIFDDVNNVINQGDIFNKIGYNLPFIYDINNLLKSYELINKEYLINKELVDELWK